MSRDKLSFSQFLDFFPPVELPISLTDDSLLVFSKENKSIPVALLQEFVLDHDPAETDEFTEYVPCFQVPNTENFFAVVYWKAQLLNYEYRLITFDLQGNFITGKVIGGTLTNGNTVIKTVANIDEDWIIHIASGEDDVRNPNYSAENTKAYTMELLSTGDIIFSLSDEDLPL